MGPSGSGKSSVLRLICGLWPIQTGVVARPEAIGRGGLFVIPQRPYLLAGTLRDQLLYPHTKESRHEDGADRRLVQLLTELDLAHLLACPGGLDAKEVWQDMLSVGEQQRIGFIRLLYHKCVAQFGRNAYDCSRGGDGGGVSRPAYALMDESTSALDVALEAKCYGMCAQANITCISIGHRLTLLPYHDVALHLDGSGGYRLATLERP